MFNFRDFDGSDRDYELALAIHNAFYPDKPNTMQAYRRSDEIRNKEHYFRRVFIESDSVTLGYGVLVECWWDNTPQTYMYGCYPTPADSYQRIASQFHDYCFSRIEREREPVKVMNYDTREDKPEVIDFLESSGFRLDNRYPRSQLRVDQFDSTAYSGLEQRIQQLGIEIVPLAEVMQRDETWLRRLYDLEWILEQDEPTIGDFKQTPFEDYKKQFEGNPDFSPESWFVALDGDHFAGISVLAPNRTWSHKMDTYWTGVDRPYRRKGLAMAMKVRAIEYARSKSVTEIETDNHERNWMYQINLKLGFEPLPAYLSYKKAC